MFDSDNKSSLHEFFDYLWRVDALFSLRLEVFQELVSLVFTPLISHSHEQLLNKLAINVS